MFDPKTGIVFPERPKNTQKTRRHQVERFITKKVIGKDSGQKYFRDTNKCGNVVK